jgi:hypothetical protein
VAVPAGVGVRVGDGVGVLVLAGVGVGVGVSFRSWPVAFTVVVSVLVWARMSFWALFTPGKLPS